MFLIGPRGKQNATKWFSSEMNELGPIVELSTKLPQNIVQSITTVPNISWRGRFSCPLASSRRDPSCLLGVSPIF